jgi:UDP-N-acetylglucosamine acyltransferase
VTSVHPTALIGPGVELGTGVTVGPYVVLTGPCRVGDGAWIGPHATIGTPAEVRGAPHPPVDADPEPDATGISIGERTVIREHVAVHRGVERTTQVGADCYLMAYSHVPHDSWLGSGVTLSSGVHLGGRCWIGPGANLGLGVVVHQRSTIGAHAMMGMQAVVTRPVPPFALAMGVPARVVGANRVGLERLGVDGQTIDAWDAQLAAGEVVHAGGDLLGAHTDRFLAEVAAAAA